MHQGVILRAAFDGQERIKRDPKCISEPLQPQTKLTPSTGTKVISLLFYNDYGISKVFSMFIKKIREVFTVYMLLYRTSSFRKCSAYVLHVGQLSFYLLQICQKVYLLWAIAHLDSCFSL